MGPEGWGGGERKVKKLLSQQDLTNSGLGICRRVWSAEAFKGSGSLGVLIRYWGREVSGQGCCTYSWCHSQRASWVRSMGGWWAGLRKAGWEVPRMYKRRGPVGSWTQMWRPSGTDQDSVQIWVHHPHKETAGAGRSSHFLLTAVLAKCDNTWINNKHEIQAQS
jgi:hypothetical protein